jgi:hypothetical protein
LGIRIISVLCALTLCGCVPTAKKFTLAGTRHQHRPHAIRSATVAHRELSDAEKDQLFRGFQRWRAAQQQIEPEVSPMTEVAQPVAAH